MTSENLWTQLQHLFQEECMSYRRLADLLREEWELLKQLDYVRLGEVTLLKEDVLTHIQVIEQKRIACANKLCPMTAQDESLAWLMDTLEPAAMPAKYALRQLVSIGQRVKQLSEKNSTLLSRGLHVVGQAMQVVHEGLGLQATYAETGCLMFPSTSTSLNIKG